MTSNFFASTIPEGIDETITYEGDTFQLELVTDQHKLYHNAEQEKSVVFWLDGELLSDNGMADVFVAESFDEPEIIVWASENYRYCQQAIAEEAAEAERLEKEVE